MPDIEGICTELPIYIGCSSKLYATLSSLRAFTGDASHSRLYLVCIAQMVQLLSTGSAYASQLFLSIQLRLGSGEESKQSYKLWHL
jgi:hypothetical protein